MLACYFMASLEEEIDPRTAVILVWAIFFFVFLKYSPACVPTWILATYPNIMNSHDTVLMGSTMIPNLRRDWTGTTTCTCSHQHRIGIGLTG